jgi:Na+/melibiose symporter-like transporter
MDNSSKMIPAYGRIWLAASIINAVLSTLLFMTDSWNSISGMFGAVVLIFVFSLLFAMPGILISMLLTAIVVSCKIRFSLFSIVLTVSFFTSLLTGIYFMNFLGGMDKGFIFLCSSIVISAVTSVFICRNYLLENVTAEE